MIRLKHAVISLMFLLAAAVATAPLGALAILSRIMERIDQRRALRALRKWDQEFQKASRKSWLDG